MEVDEGPKSGTLRKPLNDIATLFVMWNVTGPLFNTLHLMFETQYNELALAVDLIAERIRALGLPAPGSYAQFAQLTSISGRDQRAGGGRDAPATGQGSGSRGSYRSLDLPGGREGQRRTNRRPADPTDADPREDRVDATEYAGLNGREPQPLLLAVRGGWGKTLVIYRNEAVPSHRTGWQGVAWHFDRYDREASGIGSGAGARSTASALGYNQAIATVPAGAAVLTHHARPARGLPRVSFYTAS